MSADRVGAVAVQESDAAGGAPAHVRWYVVRPVAVGARPGMAELRTSVGVQPASMFGFVHRIGHPLAHSGHGALPRRDAESRFRTDCSAVEQAEGAIE